MDNLTLYNEATEILDRYEVQKNKFIKCITEITIAEIELDNIRSIATREMDDGVVSKTALKDIVAGSKAVLAAKQDLLKKKTNKEAFKATMEYLDKRYSLKKKLMSSLDSDKKYLGG